MEPDYSCFHYKEFFVRKIETGDSGLKLFREEDVVMSEVTHGVPSDGEGILNLSFHIPDFV